MKNYEPLGDPASPDWAGAITAGLLVGAAAGLLVWLGLLRIDAGEPFSFLYIGAPSSHLPPWLRALLANAHAASLFFAARGASWWTYRWYWFPASAAGIAALATGIPVGWFVGYPRGGALGAVHLHGPRLLPSPPAPIKGNTGIRIGRWRMALKDEVRHFLIVGGSGRGKTQLLWTLLRQWLERGVKMFVFDAKTDFTGALADGLILSPWDARAVRWNLGKDLKTKAEFLFLARKFCPEPKGSADPMWAKAAQVVAVAAAMECAHEKQGRWFFSDLRDVLMSMMADTKILQSIVQKRYPEGSAVVKQVESKTTQSVLFQLASTLQNVLLVGELDKKLAQAGAKSFSINGYLSAPDFKRPVLLPAHPVNDSLTADFCGLVFYLLSARLLEREDCEAGENEFALILDEFALLGDMPPVFKLLAAARSKDVRVVIGIQSPAQIKDIYSLERLQELDDNAATKFFTRLDSAESKDWASSIIGEAKWKVRRLTQNHQVGLAGAVPGGTTQSVQWATENLPAIPPAAFSTDFGALKDGVHVAVQGLGNNPCLHTFPYVSVPKNRPGRVPLEAQVPEIPTASPAQPEPERGLAAPEIPAPTIPTPAAVVVRPPAAAQAQLVAHAPEPDEPEPVVEQQQPEPAPQNDEDEDDREDEFAFLGGGSPAPAVVTAEQQTVVVDGDAGGQPPVDDYLPPKPLALAEVEQEAAGGAVDELTKTAAAPVLDAVIPGLSTAMDALETVDELMGRPVPSTPPTPMPPSAPATGAAEAEGDSKKERLRRMLKKQAEQEQEAEL